MTVQQHHRLSLAAVPHAERHFADIDAVQLETIEHEPHLPMRSRANRIGSPLSRQQHLVRGLGICGVSRQGKRKHRVIAWFAVVHPLLHQQAFAR